MAIDKLNDGMYYEVADRIECFKRIVVAQVINTRVIQTKDRWVAFAEAAVAALEMLRSEVIWSADNTQDLEASDRAVWIFEAINELLIEHPVMAHDPKAKSMANAAADKLWKLYQYLGAKDIIIDNNGTRPKPKHTGKGVHKGTKRPVSKARK